MVMASVLFFGALLAYLGSRWLTISKLSKKLRDQVVTKVLGKETMHLAYHEKRKVLELYCHGSPNGYLFDTYGLKGQFFKLEELIIDIPFPEDCRVLKIYCCNGGAIDLTKVDSPVKIEIANPYMKPLMMRGNKLFIEEDYEMYLLFKVISFVLPVMGVWSLFL